MYDLVEEEALLVLDAKPTQTELLAELTAAIQEAPEVNAARVLYFKTEIQLGTYSIQSDKIAQALSQDLSLDHAQCPI